MLQKLLYLSPLLLAAVSPAHAQPSAEPMLLEYAFDDEQVHGDTVGPDVEILRSRRLRPSESLIDVRTTFVPELTKSIENL